MYQLFRDRLDAGERLAKQLEKYTNDKDVIVLALPRGGVPVGYVVAKALGVPLDVFLVRKLGLPGQEELAMGAIASGGVRVFNEGIIRNLRPSHQEIDAVITREQAVLNKRDSLYRGDRPPLDLNGRIVILIDDGIATGATIRAAIKAIQQMGCQKLIVATPLAPSSTIKDLEKEVDEIICLETPEPFFAIGSWYNDFSQTTDAEVQRLLAYANQFNQNGE